jgi:hypothetical protein
MNRHRPLGVDSLLPGTRNAFELAWADVAQPGRRHV